MNQPRLDWITNFIWGIADDVLRDVYVRGKYRDIVLPMTVIRRLDAVLEPTKSEVLERKQLLDEQGIVNQEAILQQAVGQAFYNISPFTLRDLRSRARTQQLRADFEAYLDGFSPNVSEILEKFEFRNQISKLVNADILGDQSWMEGDLSRLGEFEPYEWEEGEFEQGRPVRYEPGVGIVIEDEPGRESCAR